MVRAFLLSAILVVSSCGGDDTAHASAGSGGGVTEASAGATSTPTSNSGTSGTSGAASQTGDAGATGDAGTTAPPHPEVEAACAAMCMRSAECMIEEFDECMPPCLGAFGEHQGDCLDLGGEALACLAGATCDELAFQLAFWHHGVCSELTEAHGDMCRCRGQPGVGIDGKSCVYTLRCPFAPDRSMLCFAGTCECFDGEDKTGECAQGDGCKGILDVSDKALSCCGFP